MKVNGEILRNKLIRVCCKKEGFPIIISVSFSKKWNNNNINDIYRVAMTALKRNIFAAI